MTTPESAPDPVLHHPRDTHGEFVIERDGRRVAELTYSLSGRDLVVGHTWGDPQLRCGRRAPDLVEAAVTWARSESRKIVPACSYVRALFSRSPEYSDVW